jgi:hypothetical protein
MISGMKPSKHLLPTSLYISLPTLHIPHHLDEHSSIIPFLSAHPISAMTAPALIIKPAIAPWHRLSSALTIEHDRWSGASTADAAARQALVVEAAVGAADGLTAATLGLGSCESGEGDCLVG